MDQPLSPLGSGLRASRPQSRRVRPPRHGPPHAAPRRGKQLITNPNFPERLLAFVSSEARRRLRPRNRCDRTRLVPQQRRSHARHDHHSREVLQPRRCRESSPRARTCWISRTTASNTTRTGNDDELAIHTRPENRARVQDCIQGPDHIIEAAGRAAKSARRALPRPNRIALQRHCRRGGCPYYAYTRERDLYAETYPSRDRSAVVDTMRRIEKPQELRREPDRDLPENSQSNLDRRLDHALEETFPTSDPVSVSITR